MSVKPRFFVGFQWLIAIFIVFICAQNTLASPYPNVIGTFSGTLSGKFLPSTPTTQVVTVVINQQNAGSFSGSISVSPANVSTTFNGTFLSATQLDFVCVGSATINAGPCFAASFNGANLTVPAAGQSGSMVLSLVSPPNLELGGILGFSGATTVDPENAPGTAIKDAGTIQTEITSVTNPVQQHTKNKLHGNGKGTKLDRTGFFIEGEGGLNAGDWQLGNVGAWLSYNYTASENDFVRTAFESDRHTVVGGVDISPENNYVLGIAIAYETSDTDTTFNAGNLESDGFTIAPYFGLLLSDVLSIDASLGFSFIDNDQFRTDPTTAARVTSDPDTDRFYFSTNLNTIHYVNNWILGGRIGFLFARSKTEDFTESNGTLVGERVTKLGELRLGGDAAYSYGDWEPFVSAFYEYDFSLDEITLTPGLQPDNDRDDVLLSAGLRYFNNNGWSGNLEYSKRLLREDFNEDSFTATVRWDF